MIQFKNEVSEFTYMRTYARWIPELKRRETWEESVDRVINFIVSNRGDLIPEKTIRKIREYMLKFEVMPSMRMVWSAGPAAQRANECIYNCSYAKLDCIEAFAEVLFLLMCGAGNGFSVEKESVNKLPIVPKIDINHKTPYIVDDSREGWADSLKDQMYALFNGIDISFDYTQLRPAGARLKTMGGRSSGSSALVKLHEFVRDTFYEAQGRKLTTLECHDIANQIAEAVVAGGVRRSAQISLSDLDDELIRHCKDFPFPPRRYMANNSAIYKSKPTAVEFLTEWSALAKSGSGERGIVNLEAAQKNSPTRRNAKLIEGCNPCISQRNWITTDDGPKQVLDLIGKPFNAIVNGESFHSDTGFFLTGEKEVFDVLTENGYWLDGITKDHLVKVEARRRIKYSRNNKSKKKLKAGYEKKICWKRVEDLEDGDRLVIGNNKDLEWGMRGQEEKGWLVGQVVGNGCHNPEKYHSYVAFWGEHAGYMAEYAENIVKSQLTPNVRFRGRSSNSEGRIIVQLSCITELCNGLIEPSTKKILPALEKQSSSFIKGFLKGFFDADGCPQGSIEKGRSIRLNQSDEEKLLTVQRLLSYLGIESNIYFRHPPKTNILPDGKGGSKEYNVKANYELVISRESIDTYAAKIGFVKPDKKVKLETLCNSITRCAYSNSFTSPLKRVIKRGTEKVYDCIVNNAHCFEANGLIIHNCGEANLRNRGLCNLTEVVARHDDDVETLMDKVETAVWIGIIQSTFTSFQYLRDTWKKNCEEERLLGVSITGICDMHENLFNEHVFNILKNKARTSARKAAKIMGINYPAAITCVKPSGTVSLLVNSSSGIHPRYSPYYIRRFRISKTDPLYRMMVDQGVVFTPENGSDIETAHTFVCEFPVKSPDSARVRADFTALQQLELYKLVQTKWCEHNVSNTIYVRDDEWFEVGNWVYKNWDIVNGLSFLPYDNGHYELAPYEEITKEQYEEIKARTPIVDYSKLAEYEEDDNTTGAKELACAGGACELK